MFFVYVQDGEFELDDAADVLKLLAAHDFRGDGGFFTIGRDAVDYLEIYQFADRCSVAYIGRDADESRPLAEDLPREFVDRIAAAFCAGGENWQASLAAADLEHSVSSDPPTTRSDRVGDPLAAAPPSAALFDARPLEPQGVTAGLFLRIVFLLSALALLVAVSYAFFHR
jgi:hypothetical protein